MSIIFLDSFDLYSKTEDLSYRWSVNGSPKPQLGRTDQGLNLPSLSSVSRNIPPCSSPTVGFAFSTSPNQIKGPCHFLTFYQNTTPSFHFCLDSNLKILAYRFDSQKSVENLIATSNRSLPLTWSFLEFKVFHDSTPRIQARINNNLTLDVTLPETQIPTYHSILIGSLPLTSPFNNLDFTIDDLYISDSTFLGDMKIVFSRPNSPGSYQQWISNSTVQKPYIITKQPESINTYLFKQIPPIQNSSPYPILAVQHSFIAHKDPSISQNVSSFVTVSTSNFVYNEIPLTSKSQLYSHILEVYPGSSNPWQSSYINTTEFGIKLLT